MNFKECYVFCGNAAIIVRDTHIFSLLFAFNKLRVLANIGYLIK